MENGSLMKVKSIAECSKGSILQYFRPALSNIWYWKPNLVFFLSGHLRQVLLYMGKHMAQDCCLIHWKAVKALASLAYTKYGCTYLSWSWVYLTAAGVSGIRVASRWLELPTPNLQAPLFVKVKRYSDLKIQYFYKINLTPLDMYNWLSQVYCIKPEGRNH